MKAVQIASAGSDFEIVDRPTPEPGPGEVRVQVKACGICHSDAFVKDGTFPGIEYPRVPGHEIAGAIDSLGEGVSGWSAGDRVGVGWHGGHCFSCAPCREGDFILCENGKISGLTFDGGYAEYTVVPAEALARVPDELSFEQAAPLLCAGITVYNALRHAPARPGDLVAVQGIGGLGHLAIQYARAMGFETVAISRGADKRGLALELGAHDYVDAEEGDPAQALAARGGARVILATAPNSRAITSVVDGLGRDGVLMVVGASADPIEVSPIQLIMGRRAIAGWPSGHAKDSEETMLFSARAGIRPRIETYPLERASDAYRTMIENRARFRVVIQP
jgi:alcohol dehydrogenase/propanol-preferring alcohol dehydrogenase